MAGELFPTAFKISGVQGTPVFFEDSVISDPGNAKLVLSFTVPAGTTRTLYQVLLSCNVRGKMQVKHEGVVIAVARTQPGSPNILFPFFPGRSVPENDTVEIEFTARSDSQAATIDAQIHATDQ
jgi:hypothetical protein